MLHERRQELLNPLFCCLKIIFVKVNANTMYRIIPLFLFLLNTFSIVFGQYQLVDSDEVYLKDEISRIDVLMEKDTLEIMVKDIFTAHKYPSSIIFSNSQTQDTIPNVGIRLRGNTSQSAAKKSFKLSFNAFEKGAKFKGYEHFNLNGEHNDPSIMRSKLCWDILHDAGFPAPKASYVALYFNNEFRGLYVNVEHIDEQFVKSRYFGNEGNLYKCTYPADLHYKGDEAELYKESFWGKRAYELKINEELDDYSDLADFIAVLNSTPTENFKCEIEKVFNVDHYLLVMAFDILVGNWDGPLYNKNNFYLYHNLSSGKFEYIPYDLDNTFGVDFLGIDWTQRNIYNWGHTEEYRPLFERILEQGEYKQQLSKILEGLLANEFKSSALNSAIDQYKMIIQDFVAMDPYYPLEFGFTYNDFISSFEEGIGGHVPFGLKEYIELRATSAIVQLEAADPEPMSYFVDFTFPDTEEDKILFISRAWNFPISQMKLYTKTAGENWASHSMLDTGFNGDLMEGDHIYSYSFQDWKYGQDIQFYLELTSPTSKTNRYPECGNYVVNLSTQLPALHFNEWMASNQNTIEDEHGNFPDWIEVYNSGALPIYIGDKYISDDPEDRTKWRMPDLAINPGQFLIFWADNEEEEGIFHTNFKLRASGEHLGMYDSKQFDFRQIDGEDFGLQTTDTSEGLLTDGGEDVVFFDIPTPKASNGTLGISEEVALEFKIIPNPTYSYFKVRSGIQSKFDLEVYNIDGRSVYKKSRIDQEFLVSSSTWGSGGFYVRIISATGKIYNYRLVILK